MNPGTGAVAAGAQETYEAHITYVTSSTIYIDAGSQLGLQKGASVQVLREGNVIATLVVAALASKRAACSRGEVDAAVKFLVGDAVRFQVTATSSPATSTNPRF